MSGRTRPFTLGLTGSIAMGKSTIAAMFAECGVPVFDADAEVRTMQEAGGELVDAIAAQFPEATGPNGVDRQALGAIVFNDKQKLAALEALIHPAVAQRRADFYTANASADLVLFDIPLLLEKNGDDNVDAVIVASAPPEVQRQRAMARDGMTAQKLDQIIALQMPDAEKRAAADYVIDTGGTLAQTRQAVKTLVEKLRADLRPIKP